MSNTQRSHEQSPWTFGRGDRLAKALEVAEVTNAEMATYLEVSANTIGNYTSGRTKPSRLQVKEWAMRTGAPYEWLENGDDVGPTGIEPMTSTVESGRLAVVLPFKRRAA